MSTTTIFTCDGCRKNIGLNDIGLTIVVGYIGHEPPSVLLHYCSSCKVPSPKGAALTKPWHIIQEIIEKTINGKVPRWLGRIHYNPNLHVFTDGYGDEPLM